MKHPVIVLALLACLFATQNLVAQKDTTRRKGIPLLTLKRIEKSGRLAVCTRKIPVGIMGTISEVKGNQMPGPGRVRTGKTPVSRVLCVYPLSKTEDFKIDDANPIFSLRHQKTNPLATVRSRPDGCYNLRLKPGRYSIVVIENNKLYANIIDGDGYVNPVTVLPGEMTQFDVIINWQATY